MIEKLTKLIKKVHEETLGGKLPWNPTSSDNIFQVNFSKNTLRVEYYDYGFNDEIGEEVNGYRITILNKESKIIEVVYPGSLDEKIIGKFPRTFLEEIYTNARRTAFNLNKAIDDMFEEIEDLR